MKALGLRLGERRSAEFPGGTLETLESRYVPVREGPGTTMILDETGTTLPDDTVVSGELFFGAERIHGRFTQAHTPDGKTYPVCMVLLDRNSRLGFGRDDVRPSESPGTIRIAFVGGVKPVERFE
jgi:serine/threonine-protein kinase